MNICEDGYFMIGGRGIEFNCEVYLSKIGILSLDYLFMNFDIIVGFVFLEFLKIFQLLL